MEASGPYISATDPHGSHWQVTADHAQARLVDRTYVGEHGAWRPMAEVRMTVGPLTLGQPNG